MDLPSGSVSICKSFVPFFSSLIDSMDKRSGKFQRRSCSFLPEICARMAGSGGISSSHLPPVSFPVVLLALSMFSCGEYAQATFGLDAIQWKENENDGPLSALKFLAIPSGPAPLPVTIPSCSGATDPRQTLKTADKSSGRGAPQKRPRPQLGTLGEPIARYTEPICIVKFPV